MTNRDANGHRSRYDRETLEELAAFIGRRTVTYPQVQIRFGWTRDRARTAMQVLTVQAGLAENNVRLWTRRPDWAARIEAQLLAHPPNVPTKAAAHRPPVLETYASPNPHDYDVDWLGRIVYRGAA